MNAHEYLIYGARSAVLTINQSGLKLHHSDLPTPIEIHS